MSTSFRHPEILRLARSAGHVTVDGLAGLLEVTRQTIRRDLADLADSGQLERVHGGAVLPSGVSNIAYEERRRLNAAAKERIGAASAALIPNEACIFLGIGTTTEATARNLMQHKNLMVVTNNLNIATLLTGNANAQVVLTGGTLRASDGGLTGPHTLDTVRAYAFDRVVLGCSAISDSGVLLDFDMDEVRVMQAVMSLTQHRILLADSSKFSRHAPVRIAPITGFDTVFCDTPLPAPVGEDCRAHRVDAILV